MITQQPHAAYNLRLIAGMPTLAAEFTNEPQGSPKISSTYWRGDAQ